MQQASIMEGKMSYDDMVIAAITSLNEPNGSSHEAIAKYIHANYNVQVGFKTRVHGALQRLERRKVLVKGSEDNPSYKIKESKPNTATQHNSSTHMREGPKKIDNFETHAMPATDPNAASVAHPSYDDMIIAAISNLNEFRGSTRNDIENYINSEYNVAHGFKSNVGIALHRLEKNVLQVSGTGANVRYKIKMPKKNVASRYRRAIVTDGGMEETDGFEETDGLETPLTPASSTAASEHRVAHPYVWYIALGLLIGAGMYYVYKKVY